MTIPRAADTRTPRSLSPPRLLARFLGHGTAATAQVGRNDFTAAASPFCSNLRFLLLPRPLR